MIHFKDHLNISKTSGFTTRGFTNRGFTLAEVIIALAVIGLMVPPIFSLAGNLMNATSRAHNLIERTIFMKNLFWQAKEEVAQKDFEKKIEDIDLSLKYKLQQPKNEKLRKFKNLFIAIATAQWEEFGRQRTDSMSTLITKEQKKTETKK
ncbi:prepilin-type N-terminal cleavage/methylation domain-containing protein [Candidatus Dependentiae bacterium]|nr:prepilin-type N-terminal cleavage/methylation domain-containing protein [Candidatus Dependentiae bacterium]